MTNPFAQPAPAQQQPAPATNPFGAGVPAQPQQAPPPAANPYAQPAPAAAPQYLGQPGPAAPAQYQAPAAQQAAPPALDMSGLRSAGAPVVGEGKGAKLADMYGRLVLVFPLSCSRVPRNPQYITPEQRQRGDLDQERLVATIVVLDDGQGGMQPISYGGNVAAFPPVPNTDTAPLPYVRKAMWINQSRLISQLREALPAEPGAAPGMRLGRVVKAGPQHNDPWYLQGATEQDLALAGQYLQLVQSGQYPHPLA